MIRFLRGALAALLVFAGAPAFAQSTAEPVIPGYLTTTGCLYGLTTCFVQFGANGALAVSGFDSGTQPVQTATPNSSSHAAGTSVGGLFSVPLARTAGNSGEVGNLLWISSGGDATGKLVRVYDKNPTGGLYTCTDQVAFVDTVAAAQHLLTSPFAMTPAAPTNTTGDAKTYAAVSFTPPLSFANQDATATRIVYACVTTTATDTLDESAPVYLDLTGPLN